MELKYLEKYAPQARIDFIRAVTDRAGKLGLTEENIADATLSGDAMIINGVDFPIRLASLRNTLIARINSEGFQSVMEHAAYSWFNRLVAIRFMELHGYLDHDYKVLAALPEAMTRKFSAT